jgi:hypothetical protein
MRGGGGSTGRDGGGGGMELGEEERKGCYGRKGD